MNSNLLGKIINASLLGDRHMDKPLDEYMYASLTQPPIKIIDKCGSEDEMDYIVECPNCGNHVVYGESIYMIGGHLYCSNEKCREEVINNYERTKQGF